MPAKSKNQLKAMAAAASGKSTLGIPPKVGQEFLDATPKGTAKNLPTTVGQNMPEDNMPMDMPPQKAPPKKGKKGKDFHFGAPKK